MRPPKYLTCDCELIETLLQVMLRILQAARRFLLPNRIDSVLPRWRDNLLSVIKPLAYRLQLDTKFTLYIGRVFTYDY